MLNVFLVFVNYFELLRDTFAIIYWAPSGDWFVAT